MPLVRGKQNVLEVYAEAAERKWVVPTFCSENLTTTEAVLAAVKEHGEKIGVKNPPVALAITNLYDHRSQSLNYTRSGDWRIGLGLFMADLEVLCGKDSPYGGMRVMAHLDHIRPDLDGALLESDMLGRFSSIMYDASAFPLEENIRMTREFVEMRGADLAVEGACDEIKDATGGEANSLTTPRQAEKFMRGTGVDFMVANLGTEHRASAAELKYHGDLAAEISGLVGPKLVLHGCSSVSDDQIMNLFADGVCKVNIWTILERDSSPALLEDMARNAAKVAGAKTAARLLAGEILGGKADTASKASLSHFTTVYRQDIVFREMKKITGRFLEMWYK